MNEGDGKQGISREGPLRSLSTPPFAGPVALRNAGPLVPAPRDSNSHTSGDAGASNDPLAPAYQHGPPSNQSRRMIHPLHPAPPLQHQQPSTQAVFPNSSPNPAASSSSVGHQPISKPTAPTSTPMSFPTPGASSSNIPKVELQTGRDTSTGLGRSHDSYHRTASASDSRNFPVAQTQAPPLAPEPTPTARVAPASASGYRAAAPSSSPMPALPPPPAPYSGSNYATSARHYQPQHLPRAMPPLSAGSYTPQTTPPTPVHAAFGPPPASPQEKSLDELVSEFLSASALPEPEPTNEDLTLNDPEGWVAALGYLARRRAWASVVDVVEKMLAMHERAEAPGLTLEQVMSLRLRRALAMLRIGRTEEAAEAASEAAQREEHPPLCTVRVAARFVAASAKSLCSGVAEEEAVDELTALKVDLEEIMSPGFANPSSADGGESSTLTAAVAAEWRRRVVVSLANVFVRRGSWRLALGLLEAMGEEYASSARIGKDRWEDGTMPVRAVIEGSAMVAAIRVDVLTRIGRVFLQFGALKDAEVYFNRAEETALEPANDSRILVNNGLLFFSKNNFVAAQESFQKAASAAAKAAPSNIDDDDWLWAYLDEGAALLGCALNNLSLAMVYSCNVIGAVRTLEGLILKDPRLYMLDVVVFNLCTLYDLSFDPVTSIKKKKILQAVAQRFRLEDIEATSFRLS